MDYKSKYYKYKKKYLDLNNKIGSGTTHRLKWKNSKLKNRISESRLLNVNIPDQNFNILNNKLEFFDNYYQSKLMKFIKAKFKIIIDFHSLQDLNHNLKIKKDGNSIFLLTTIKPTIYIRNANQDSFLRRNKFSQNNSNPIKIIQTPYLYQLLRKSMIRLRSLPSHWYSIFKSDESKEKLFFKKKNLLSENQFGNGNLITIPKIDDYSENIDNIKQKQNYKTVKLHSIYVPNINYENELVTVLDLDIRHIDDLISFKESITTMIIEKFGFKEQDIYIYSYIANMHNPVFDFYIDCVNEENIKFKTKYEYDTLWSIEHLIDHLKLQKENNAPSLSNMIFEYMILPSALPIEFNIDKYLQMVNSGIFNQNNIFDMNIWNYIYKNIFKTEQIDLEDISWFEKKSEFQKNSKFKQISNKTQFAGSNNYDYSFDNAQIDDLVIVGNNIYNVKINGEWYQMTINFDNLLGKNIQYKLWFDTEEYRYGSITNQNIIFNLLKLDSFSDEVVLNYKFLWQIDTEESSNNYYSTGNNLEKLSPALQRVESWNDFNLIKNMYSNNLLVDNDYYNLVGRLIMIFNKFGELIPQITNEEEFNQLKNKKNNEFEAQIGFNPTWSDGVNAHIAVKNNLYKLKEINPFIYWIVWLIGNRRRTGLRDLKSQDIDYIKKILGKSIFFIKRIYEIQSILSVISYIFIHYPNRKQNLNLHINIGFFPSDNQDNIGYNTQYTNNESNMRDFHIFQVFDILSRYPNYFKKRKYKYLTSRVRYSHYVTNQ